VSKASERARHYYRRVSCKRPWALNPSLLNFDRYALARLRG